jgi:peptide/nickel transport system ATP-binding protein
MEQVLAVLEQVGLVPPRLYLERLPSELSGGQRQRVALARALITNPRLLLADEPLSMLDFNLRRQLLDLLLKLNEERKLAVLFVTHDPGLARYAARPILYLEKGRLQPQSQGPSFMELNRLLVPDAARFDFPSPLTFK